MNRNAAMVLHEISLLVGKYNLTESDIRAVIAALVDAAKVADQQLAAARQRRWMN